LDDNRRFWHSSDVPPWIRELRGAARSQIALLADDYCRSYLPALEGTTDPRNRSIDQDPPWIVGGHQPELFHPGVWFKNILIDQLAKETNSLGFHAIIDHDLLRSASVRVPARDPDRNMAFATTVPLPLSRPTTPDPYLPWNDWRIDPSQIDEASQQIQRALRSIGLKQSMVPDFFQQLRTTGPDIDAAQALSQVRHRIEHRHGISNREFPMSQLCRTVSWRVFLTHCVANASELHAIYNHCLDEYRNAEGITNPTQPVPRLGRQESWVELPFWLRLPGQYARHRMWVECESARCRVAAQPNDYGRVRDWNDGFPDDSWIIWPRALMTTLFLRVFLADLFVHGIGGGQYDRLTDRIIERFLRIQPPKFVTCTATLWLEFSEIEELTEDHLARLSADLEREHHMLRSAPERFLNLDHTNEKRLWENHRHWIASIPPRGQRKSWHAEMKGLKSSIAAAVEDHRIDWQRRKQAHDGLLSQRRILQSREFAYILFGEQNLFDRLGHLAR
jgi:hypothetical protein